ncbi:MAG: DUF2723 domain-containing protein [Flavipsychrobacter sp.]|nr:DUF2723 domain-containing protein [Flavipsychrobacter sp.]
MNYRSVNNITGWLTALAALIVYLLTLEPTTSFWDCGEFLACAYKLEVGHAPGAPFFMMMQRLFSLLAGGDRQQVAWFINAESAVASAFTILFLFWTITHMARKLVTPAGGGLTGTQVWLVMSAGLTGALAYTFSDTFWFSAVEAEVYATSSFFTALVFWAALKWEEQAGQRHADRWLVLIALLVGISVGVHLLNLLAIPAVAMVVYFRRYKPGARGMAAALLVGVAILAFVQFGVIQYLPIFASRFDLLFVNTFGLPFNSGAITFMLLLLAGLVAGVVWARKSGRYILHLSLVSITFIIVGFSSYLVPIIRSTADTPVDMTNPDNVMSLVSYVQRSQYLQQPLLTGPDFNSQVTGTEKKGAVYARVQRNGADHYEQVDDKVNYTYAPGSTRFFPRIWNADENHARFYRGQLGLAEGESPSSADNFSYFFNYQLGWMWWRYFMWNYSGRQNSYHGHGNAKNGNWITGLPALDKHKVGDMDAMSAPYRYNKARNQYYLLPLALGLAGVVYHFRRGRNDAIVTLVLFFFTGIAIAIYLNMTPLQPRERDYAFAGGTYAFAVWIGLGVLLVHQAAGRLVKGGAGVALAVVLCLAAVPALMAREGWDDHDRSGRTQAWASAYNTLNSCAPNAILFCSADNDTYPLWYLQEVEGVRTDVRVIITELLGTDWYIDQLRYRVNDAPPVPMAWSYDDYKGGNHNYVPFYAAPALNQETYYNLEEVCRFINSTDERNKVQSSSGSRMNYLPVKNISLSAPGKDEIVKNGWLADTSGVENEVKFTIDKQHLFKNDLAILHIIAAVAKDGWKRPVYFNGSYPGNGNPLGMGRYLHMEGINYRLLPFTYSALPARALDAGPVNIERSLELLMNVYQWGGAERKDIHFDDKHTVMMISYRIIATRLAEALINAGRRQEAIQVLDKVNTSLPAHNYPYDMAACYMAAAYYNAGTTEKAREMGEAIVQQATDDIKWVSTLGEEQQQGVATDVQSGLSQINLLAGAARDAGDTEYAGRWNGQLQQLYNKMLPLLEAGR